MNVTLPDEVADYVGKKVASGQYLSPADVLRDAVRLLREQEEDEGKLADLRREIAIGIKAADEGRVAPFSAAETLARVRQRRAATKAEEP